MPEIQFSANSLGTKSYDFVMMDGQGNKGPSPNKRQKMTSELSESDLAKHEEKKRKNREAVRKHRERQRLKHASDVINSEGSFSRWRSSSMDSDGDLASTSQAIVTAMPPSGSNKTAQRQSLMALANAALSEQIPNSPRRDQHLPYDLLEDVHRDSPSSARTCSVSTQTDTSGLSSSISEPLERSTAIQTPDLCLGGPDYRLRRCTWSDNSTESRSRSSLRIRTAATRSTLSYQRCLSR